MSDVDEGATMTDPDPSLDELAGSAPAAAPGGDAGDETPAPALAAAPEIAPAPEPAQIDAIEAATARCSPAKWTQAYVNTLPDPAGLTEAECRAELAAIGDPAARISALQAEYTGMRARNMEAARKAQADEHLAHAAYNKAMLEGQWSKHRAHVVGQRLAELAAGA